MASPATAGANVASVNTSLPGAEPQPSTSTTPPPAGPPVSTPITLPVTSTTPAAVPVVPQSSSSTTPPTPGVPPTSSLTPLVTSITPVESSSRISSDNKTRTGQKSSTSSAGQSRASGAPTHHGGLSNGGVAGIVIAVGLGLALATFIATFLIMRRRRTSGHKKNHRQSKEQAGFAPGTGKETGPQSEPSELPVTESSGISVRYEKYLPQSADDKTIQNSVKTMLDQVEIYVDNFYRNDSGLSGIRPGADLDVYNSPDLPSSLASLLAQSKQSTVLIKHALAQCVTSSISPHSRTDSSLLPNESMLMTTADEAAGIKERARPGYDQCLSRWRVLTAYLRPSPSRDPMYLAQRDQRIAEKIERFSRDFAPWKNINHEDASRNRSLSAIFRSAADLGIFIFSQPSDIRFQWPRQSETGAAKIVVTPSLIKTTDEMGQPLAKSQVLLKAVIEKI